MFVIRTVHREQFPFILLPIELTKKMKEEIKIAGFEIGTGEQIIIDKSENVLRIAGLINDAYEYTKNDENFKRK